MDLTKKVIWFSNYFKGKLDNEKNKYYDYIKDDISNSINRGLILLNINKDNLIENPIIIISPKSLNYNKPLNLKLTKDKYKNYNIETTENFITIIYITKTNRLCIYATYIDHRFSLFLNEEAIDFKINSIKDIAIDSNKIKIKNKINYKKYLNIYLKNNKNYKIEILNLLTDINDNNDYINYEDLLNKLTKYTKTNII